MSGQLKSPVNTMFVKGAEFETALLYLKPDIICTTQSWLKGVKPGVDPTKDTLKSSEIFPPNYNVYRNDRGTLGVGVLFVCPILCQGN
jgi:hypothetical protein